MRYTRNCDLFRKLMIEDCLAPTGEGGNLKERRGPDEVKKINKNKNTPGNGRRRRKSPFFS